MPLSRRTIARCVLSGCILFAGFSGCAPLCWHYAVAERMALHQQVLNRNEPGLLERPGTSGDDAIRYLVHFAERATR